MFTYTPENWAKMIPGVDRLEGFSPRRLLESSGDRWYKHGYFRTLAWLRMLPADYESPFYDGRSHWSDGPRDLQIPEEKWEDYPKVPCWVYSSLHENELNWKLSDTPLIWPTLAKASSAEDTSK